MMAPSTGQISATEKSGHLTVILEHLHSQYALLEDVEKQAYQLEELLIGPGGDAAAGPLKEEVRETPGGQLGEILHAVCRNTASVRRTTQLLQRIRGEL
jgi:hypothetical protein